MKYTVEQLKDRFTSLSGDTSIDIETEFFINALNWAIGGLPLIPKLDKIFSKHYHFNLDAKDNYKWNLNADFRRITDIPMLNFYTSTGGEPCRINICPKDTVSFYNRNGLIEMKQAGTPCQYTLEQQDDDIFLVFDRPLDIPIIVDYIAYGFLKPVSKLSDEIELSGIAEPLVLTAIKEVWLQEADDYAFSGAVGDYISNELIPQATQALYKRFGTQRNSILGEV